MPTLGYAIILKILGVAGTLLIPGLVEQAVGGRRRRLGRAERKAATIMDRLKVEKTELPPVGTSSSTSPRHRKITFARLATCILNVERARKRSSRAREEELLQASETGDVQKLRSLLQNRDCNIECSDQLGRTPLLLAVVNEHKEAVRLLLDHVDKHRVYQALLSAINLGNEEIAEIIIEHPKYEAISNDLKEQGKAHCYLHRLSDDNQFSDVITPLILAAQQNRFEVVMALLLKGESIEKPHKCHCACSTCVAQAKRDELKFARSRLNAYTALASEAYISLSSEDPILTSFLLRQTLQHVAKEEKYYTIEYTALANKLSEYVVRLLDKVHGNEELNAILNAADDGEVKSDRLLHRLQLAIKFKEKKFVAHPSCQKKMTTLWYEDLHHIPKYRSTIFQLPVVCLIILLYPALALGFLLLPNTWLGRLMRTPCIKFIAQASSYVFFLGIILIHATVVQAKLCTSKFGDIVDVSPHLQILRRNANGTGIMHRVEDMCIRNHNLPAIELCIMIWIAGLLCRALKQLYTVGGQTHFDNIYHSMDFFMLKFYIASLTLRRLEVYKVRSSLAFFKDESSILKLSNNDEEALHRLYWINADRYYWDSWDPAHLGECFFAVGHILNFARIFHLLAINEHLGPMLISLKRMLKDMTKFFLTFVPIMLAFMVGMYNIYWYYNPEVRGQVETKDHKIVTRAEEGFKNPEYTFRTIYWAVFGLKDARSVELEGYESRVTESVGYIVFGVYNWGAAIVLLNMLIAMMTRSFDKISSDQDIEWKFSRSKLYMDFIRPGNTLPVPFNLIPSPKNIVGMVQHFIASCRACYVCDRFNREPVVGDVEDEIPPYYCINGANNLLIGKHYIGQCNSLEMKSPPEQPEEKGAESSPSLDTKSKRNQYQRITLQDPDAPGANAEYKAVIKRVVRRYIFDHLLASVVPNEGSQELDTIKQQTHALQHDVGCLPPKIEEQSQTIQSQLRLLSKNVASMREQMNNLMQVCQTLQKTGRDFGDGQDGHKERRVAACLPLNAQGHSDNPRPKSQRHLWSTLNAAVSGNQCEAEPQHELDNSNCPSHANASTHNSDCGQIMSEGPGVRVQPLPKPAELHHGHGDKNDTNELATVMDYNLPPLPVQNSSNKSGFSQCQDTELPSNITAQLAAQRMDYAPDDTPVHNVNSVEKETTVPSPDDLSQEIVWRSRVYDENFPGVETVAASQSAETAAESAYNTKAKSISGLKQESSQGSASISEEEIFPHSSDTLHPPSQELHAPSFKARPKTPPRVCQKNAFTYSF